MNIKKILYSMACMFTNLGRIKSIKFLPGFDSSKVTNLEEMFACTLIESMDMKNLDTSNVLTLNNFLSYSHSITSLDLSNFNTSKTYKMREMFKENNNLKVVDLSSFDTSKISDCLVMFHDFPINCTIKISNEFIKCKEQIAYENKIINADNLVCNNFDNWEKCWGSKKTLFYIKCKAGYQLKNYECVKAKWDLGDNEKCLLCQNIPDKENEYLEWMKDIIYNQIFLIKKNV